MTYKEQDYIMFCRACGQLISMLDHRSHTQYCGQACKVMLERKIKALRKRRKGGLKHNGKRGNRNTES